MRQKPGGDPTTAPAQAVLAVVLQVRDGRLQALLWQRARKPFSGAWALPGGRSRPTRRWKGRSGASWPRRWTRARPPGTARDVERARAPSQPRGAATAFLGLVPADVDPELPADTAWHVVDDLPRLAFDHAEIVLAARERAAASSPTRTSASRWRPAPSRSRSCAASTRPRSATTSRRRTQALRRDVLRATGTRREGRAGGGRRRSTRFRSRRLEITDPSPRCVRPPSAAAPRLRRSATAAAPSRRPACACRRRASPSPCARASARSPAR